MECNLEHLLKNCTELIFEVLHLSISIFRHFALPLFEANIVVTQLHLFYNFGYLIHFRWLAPAEAE